MIKYQIIYYNDYLIKHIERSFSSQSWFQSDKRSRLTHERASKMTFISHYGFVKQRPITTRSNASQTNDTYNEDKLMGPIFSKRLFLIQLVMIMKA